MPQTSPSATWPAKPFVVAAAVAVAAAAVLAAALAAAVDSVDRELLVRVLVVVDAEVAVARAAVRALVGPRRRQCYCCSKGQQPLQASVAAASWQAAAAGELGDVFEVLFADLVASRDGAGNHIDGLRVYVSRECSSRLCFAVFFTSCLLAC